MKVRDKKEMKRHIKKKTELSAETGISAATEREIYIH